MNCEFIESELEIMVYWIHEREAIRKAKEAGAPKPWTTDPLLRDYRWCNVSRMDDRVSVDLMKGWYRPADARTQLVAATLGRLINWPQALLEGTEGSPFSMGHLAGLRPRLRARAARSEKIFTGAYVVPGVPGSNKIDSTLDLVQRVSGRAGEILKSTMKSTWAELLEMDGLGSFLAGQIVADLARLDTGADWPDRDTWAPVGPGSARGINRLYGRPKNQAVSQGQFEIDLREYIREVRPRIEMIADDRKLHAQDFQGTHCEFDKYRRLTLGEGSVRARYDGAGDAQGSLL